ncbi:MAG: sugar transferase [Planctomycetota bacterium]
MLQQHKLAVARLTLAADLALLAASVVVMRKLAATGEFRWLAPPAEVSRTEAIVQLVVLVVAWLVLSNRMSVYRSRRTDSLWSEFQVIAQAWFLALAISALAGHALHEGHVLAPLTYFPLGFLMLAGLRGTVRIGLRVARGRGRNYRRALFVGGGAGASRMVTKLQENPHFGIKTVGGVTMDGATDALPPGVEPLGGHTHLQRILSAQEIDYVMLCPPPEALAAQISEVFAVCNEAGIPCHYLPSFLTMSTRNLHPRLEWYGDMPALAFHAQPFHPVKLATKRTIDLAVSISALIFLAPLLLVIAAIIRLQDGGPALFAQERVGRGGRRFRCLKFRTMHVNAEAMQADLRAQNEQDGPAFKISDDPRITRIGKFLRRYSLDELPQLLNVLVGHMSLVGPRPPIPSEVARYAWWQRRRISVSPGLTCIWQVWGRPKRVSFEQWMAMDLYYVDNWSLGMDIRLMLRTLGAVLRGTGS